jgi:predicted metal-dependent phosphoesterase TrpH
MRVDLHVHTSPRSPCSEIDPHEMVAEAGRLGLDAVCLTEHHVLWDRGDVEELAREGGVRLFRGNEITTNQGDVLVFDYDVEVPDVALIQELYEDVQAAGGLVIAAHPMRGFKMFSVGQLQLTAEQASQRPVFQYVDAVEVRNGTLSEEENGLAAEVAERLGLPGTAGSDAHRLGDLGRWVTIFEHEVHDERELVRELRAGRFRVESGRD